ncbi:MAG: FAD-binding and (Fe-S)-binding domain-containing protein [Candidatus Neomarinimicrobiota bacterium]
MNLDNYIDKNKILNREIDKLAYARDASIYRILPEFVVRPKNENDIQQLFKYVNNSYKSITFRASGTSLSGQTVTNGIIAEIAYDWQKIDVRNDGKSILLEPGVIGEYANQKLKKYQRRIGPDPASIKVARIGGIVANNSSGMTTGKPYNSYNTLMHVRFILANGNIFDTAKKSDYERFMVKEKWFAEELIKIRKTILQKDTLRNKILEKYRIKNTIGFSLNSFLDYNHPLDIFAHLLVGSEGTLAFISNVELETVPDPPFKSTGLVLFPTIKLACNAINAIKTTNVKALELMDHASLKTAKYFSSAAYDVDSLPKDSAALLCEFQEDNYNLFDSLESNLISVILKYNGSLVGKFEKEDIERSKLWEIRKSLFTTIGSLRKPGTSVITEDICFDVDELGDSISELHRIFAKWDYQDAVIFGHAKDGNLHFVTSIDLESNEGITRYEGMLEDVAKLTVDKFNGSLKGEHGTGRNMAPFVEREWGIELYNIMWKIKNIADPNYVLNPGVILNRNKNIHIENLKPMPAINDNIDLCVECGYCEPVCPSRGFTFTPRQRICVSRELEMIGSNNKKISRSLENDYLFCTELTCAVDGMCETVCPINLDTGMFVRDLRNQHNSIIGKLIASWASDHFSLTTKLIKYTVKIILLQTKIFGSKMIDNAFNLINKLSKTHIPAWNSNISGVNNIPLKSEYGAGKQFIYYPSCINRVFGADSNNHSIIEVMAQIAELAKINLTIPDKIDNTCCSTPFSSKGFNETAVKMFEKVICLLYDASKGGKMQIVVDTSPCTYKFVHPPNDISIEIIEKWKKLNFIDIIPFLNSITKNITHKPLDRSIVLHQTCSTQKLEQVRLMESLANRCAAKVIIIDNNNCCGFAGDRGLIIPQLTNNAVKFNKEQLIGDERELNGYSSSRMCEIGMSDNNQFFSSIALLVRDYLVSN